MRPYRKLTYNDKHSILTMSLRFQTSGLLDTSNISKIIQSMDEALNYRINIVSSMEEFKESLPKDKYSNTPNSEGRSLNITDVINIRSDQKGFSKIIVAIVDVHKRLTANYQELIIYLVPNIV